MLQEKNPKINSDIINKNPIPNLFVNQSFANIYYFYFCNKVILLQLLVNNPALSSVMIYFNLK